MPHKGFFTQGVAVLTERALTADDMAGALAKFDVVKHTTAEEERAARPKLSEFKGFNWMGGHETWVVAFRPEVNGYVVVESIAAPWPDHMGDPKAEPMLFGAWSMGFFGPFAWPGNFERATTYANAFGQKQTVAAARRHAALVRIRSTYVLGADDNARVMPDDYGPRAELEFVTSVARALLDADAALCYFNPNGETLYTADEIDAMRAACPPELPPLPLWSGCRMMRIDDAPPWMLADVVGMQQLDALDHEACFRRGAHDPNEVLGFLRNCAQYTLDAGPIMKTGNTTDGPGGIWRAIELEEPLIPAPRPVIRWYPDAGPRPPKQLLTAPPRQAAEEAPASAPSRGLFGRIKSLFGG